jgi:peptidyl-prolyl cis-trans isomerase C
MRAQTWALAALAGLALVLSARDAAAQAAKPAAVVNGETITVQEVDAAIQARGPVAVELASARRRQMQLDMLGLMIDNLLMEQFLRQQGPRVDPAEVNKHMADLEQAVKKAGKTLADYYAQTQQNEQQVRAAIARMLQWEAFARGRISDADVKRYYDENKDFFDGVTVCASHVMLRVPRNAPDADRQAARQKLLAVRQEIVSGQTDFAAAAKKYSQCPASAADGGAVGRFTRKMSGLEESFVKAAFALPPGQLSDVVATEFGLHLILVTERKAGEQPAEFEKIKDFVRDCCTLELQQGVLAQQRQAAKIEVMIE